MKKALLVAFATLLLGCSDHAVNTFPEWCEQIIGVDLEQKYRPFWAVIFSVSFDGDAIRDDFVQFVDDLYLEKVDNRAPRMAWREGTALHLINLSSLMEIEPEEMISQWRNGIEAAKNFQNEDAASTCLYGTVTSMFDSLSIHSMTPDDLGISWTDSLTVFSTDRKERLSDHVL